MHTLWLEKLWQISTLLLIIRRPQQIVPIEGSSKEKPLHSYKVNVFVDRYYLEQAFGRVF